MMKYKHTPLIVCTLVYLLNVAICEECSVSCPPSGNYEMACGFDPKGQKYKMFPSKCNLEAFMECNKVGLIETPLKFCINDIKKARKMYGESCPVFCPNHYRPVCGASKLRSYVYQTFNNGCYFDMINCRGIEDSGFVEVPLEFCQNHLMKNIFEEKMVITNFQEYRDYHPF